MSRISQAGRNPSKERSQAVKEIAPPSPNASSEDRAIAHGAQGGEGARIFVEWSVGRPAIHENMKCDVDALSRHNMGKGPPLGVEQNKGRPTVQARVLNDGVSTLHFLLWQNSNGFQILLGKYLKAIELALVVQHDARAIDLSTPPSPSSSLSLPALLL